jgi:hypothetical protein
MTCLRQDIVPSWTVLTPALVPPSWFHLASYHWLVKYELFVDRVATGAIFIFNGSLDRWSIYTGFPF